jgi:hypothetical protein
MKKECIISNLFLFFKIISLKTNTFIPAMLQCHYPIPEVVLSKICKIPLYSCNPLLIRRKTLTSKEGLSSGKRQKSEETKSGE